MKYKEKIHSLSRLPSLLKKINKETIVLVGGCFDLLHYGHLYFFLRAKSRGTKLVVLLESDLFIKKKKHKKPVHSQKQRAEILASLEQVDYVVCLPFLDNPDEQYTKLVSQIKPSVIAWTKGDIHDGKKRILAQRVKAQIYIVSFLKAFSSSQLTTYAPVFRD